MPLIYIYDFIISYDFNISTYVRIYNNKSLLQMTSKFKIEYYHKMPQNTSPYLQLLQAKKKIFGYKYQLIRSDKTHSHSQHHNHNKSTGHQPSQKHSKTQSHQKDKSRTHKMASRKKRSQTQQAQERLHQSLFLNRDVEMKQGKHQATKSLFTAQGGIDHSINPHDFMKNYKNLLDHDDRNIKSVTQQVQGRPLSKSKRAAGQGTSLQKLQITQIDDLINLIDTCVQQANDYIGYLTERIQVMKNESSIMKQQQIKILKMKDGIINEKERELDRLRRQLHTQGRSQPDKSFQIKKLLEVIDKITEQNNSLKGRLKQFEMADLPRPQKQHLEKDKKDIYNEIHNKIDILNISIDKKHQESGGEVQAVKEVKKGKNSKNRFYR